MDDTSNKFIPEYRRTNFKNKGRFQSDELRRRRETHQVDLRKQKREEVLAKRRNYVDNGLLANDSEDEDALDEFGAASPEELLFYGKLQQDLPKMMEMIQLPDFDNRLNATVKFRQVLSKEHNPPIDFVIQLGVIPTLVQFMSEGNPDMLQLEAAWALTNIASGSSDQTRVVVEAGAVPHFVMLLYSQLLEVKEQGLRVGKRRHGARVVAFQHNEAPVDPYRHMDVAELV